MQPEKPYKWNSKISAQSKISNRSSIRSLDRGSWQEREPSLNKQHNMIEVMSLQSSKKSDIYEKMLAEETPQAPGSDLEKEEDRAFNPFSTVIKFAPDPINNRFSYEPKQELSHICLCYEICNEQRCPCYLAKDEECLEGYCCKECIQTKNRKVVRSGLPEPDPKTFCTCKKTKCNKKYCTCFAAGVKCGFNCSCEDCLNCDKPQKMQFQPVCIVDEEIKQLAMPQSMQFEPFAFRF